MVIVIGYGSWLFAKLKLKLTTKTKNYLTKNRNDLPCR